jgi:sterol-4alpha-carboxylate 3-dehydrogenase (decarboxylating)
VRTVLETVKPKGIMHTISPQLMGHKNTNKLYEDVNVGGTKILLGCIADTDYVKALIYTSSSSVVHNNVTDLVEATEEGRLVYWPETTEFDSHTKAMAEDLIQSALTTRLRGSLLFGEGDTTATPQTIANARFQIGDGTNLFDFTYIGKTAYADILAAEALLREADGRASPNKPLKVN